METNNNRVYIEYEVEYLKLALKIARLRYQGMEPPEELLQQAYEAGRLANVSEKELKQL
jgi:hypothetical protein